MTDHEIILGTKTELKLSTGALVYIRPLKTIELFKLLRIISHATATMLSQFSIDGDLDTEEFQQRFLTLIVLSVPEADEAALEFLRAVVEPKGLTPNPKSKQDKENNDQLWAEISEALWNPELDDTISIIEAIVKAEAPHVQSLGKRIMALMKVAMPKLNVPEKMTSAQDSETPTSTESTPLASSGDSLTLSTSSPTTTNGLTITSSTDQLLD